MRFIGRDVELKKLNRMLENNNMTFSLVYGRRRIGKSELVKQLLRENDVKSIYYECKQVSHASNVKSLSDVTSETLGMPVLGYTEIEDLLSFIFDRAKEEKMVLVLDEYPYLRGSIEGIDSILQSLIDKYRDSSRLKLIILGSYVEVMRSLLEHSNPLFGRVDLVIDLKQMNYRDSALFYPNFSDDDKVRIYSVFGGIPYYNLLIDDSLSVRENIIELIASPGARLENEVSMYLNAEISKITNANEVFEALARGYRKYNDILSHSHVSSGPTMIDVLDKLIKMEVVEKTAPINGEKNKRKYMYRISDNLSLFYFRYIFRYLSQLNIMDKDTFYDRYIKEDFEQQYVPHQFETICRQYLIDQNRKGEIDPVFEKIGTYYYDDPKNHRNGEFDIVTMDEKGYVFYEAKFRKDPVSGSMIKEEIAQVEATGLSCYRYVLISRSGFTIESQDNISLIDISDLY